MLSRDEFLLQLKSRKIFYFVCDTLHTDESRIYFICIMVQPDRIIEFVLLHFTFLIPLND